MLCYQWTNGKRLISNSGKQLAPSLGENTNGKILHRHRKNIKVQGVGDYTEQIKPITSMFFGVAPLLAFTGRS